MSKDEAMTQKTRYVKDKNTLQMETLVYFTIISLL